MVHGTESEKSRIMCVHVYVVVEMLVVTSMVISGLTCTDSTPDKSVDILICYTFPPLSLLTFCDAVDLPISKKKQALSYFVFRTYADLAL